jgi:hypothetical protein
MKKNLLILAGLAIFNTCFSQTNQANNQVLGGGNSSALDFDGLDDKVTTPIIFNSTTYANWTIECWAKSPSSPGSTLGYDGPMYGDNAGIIWHHGSSAFQGAGTVQASDGSYFAASFGTLAPDTWYHLAVTYDGTLLKAYKNGNLMNTTTTTGGMLTGNFPLVIGKHPTQGGHWQGAIDDARVWTTARTCEQISANLNNSILSETGLVSSYTFNEGVPNGSNTSLTAVQNGVNFTSDGTLAGFALSGSTSNFVPSAPFNLPIVCVTEVASGLAGDCLAFTGANDLVKVPNSVSFTDYTIECNVLLKDLNDQNIIVATNASGTNISASHQIKLINGNFAHYLYDGNPRTLESPVNVVTNQWYHVSIFVKAGQYMGINVDGNTNYLPSAIGTPWSGLTEFRFGGSAIGVGDFNGKLDEVRMWDRVLCSAEIANFSNCEVTFPNTGLRTVFHFNQGVDGADNTGIDSLFADNSSLVGTMANFTLNGNTSNWDDAGVITTGVNCATFTGICNAKALNFDGVNDHVTVGVNSLLEMSNGTIEAWIQTNNAGAGYRGIVSKVNAYGLFLNNNVLTTYNWANATLYSAGPALNDNLWHHVAIVFKSGVANGSRLYIDGLPVGTDFTYTSLNQNNPLTIGNNSLAPAPNQFFNGNIDAVRVWDRALCPTEINANKNCAIALGTANLVVQYNFEQGIDNANNSTVQVLFDGGGNNLNGTLTNFALNGLVSNWTGNSTVSAAQCNSLLTDIVEINGTIASVTTGGTGFQWADCSGNNISGATSLDYTPGVSGQYMVYVEDAGCTIPSECYSFNFVGMKENLENKDVVSVFPNPAKDKLNVKAEGKSLKVFNSLGIVVLTATLTKNETELQLTDLNSGVYYIVTDLGATVKFIKQ